MSMDISEESEIKRTGWESRRRDVLKATAAMAMGSVLGGGVSLAADARKTSGRLPRVVGPITGGRHGRPFAAYLGNIADVGYVEEEYFIEGDASAFRFNGEFPVDGRFAVSKIGATPYRTRILVRRPVDAGKFNGTVVVEWINVSAGHDIACADLKGNYQGFAWVSVSAQRVGVHGLEPVPRAELPPANGLRQWDPDRYGSLSIPGDSLSYDIFTQGARAVAPYRTGKIDPMGGLKVRKLIAIGASQSGIRLVSYINGVQSIENVFDALMPIVFFGRSAPWIDGQMNDPRLNVGPKQSGLTRMRDDLSAKIFGINTETEAASYLPVRQPDTESFRYWEIAGASHGGTAREEQIRRIAKRDGMSDPDNGSTLHISDVLWQPTCDAAIHHVHRWMNGGDPPPRQRKIEFKVAATPAVPERDSYGNARGGVRLPEVEVPIAQYAGATEASPFNGQTFPFAADRLKSLYPTHADYVAKVKAAAERAMKEGVILPYRVNEYIAQAEAAAVPA